MQPRTAPAGQMRSSASRCLILLLGACSLSFVGTHVSLVLGFQSPGNGLTTVEGTAFALYGDRTDVVIPEGGPVVLEPLHGKRSTRVPLGDLGEYRLKIPSGTYQIGFVSPRYFLPYRRAHIRISAGVRNVVNLYPAQRTGIALTVHGDVALPDPKLLYESYYPNKEEPDLDMLIQYGRRVATATGINYEGGFLTLTFDNLTLRTSALVLNQTTLTVEAPHKTLVDGGSFRLEADRASLNPRTRLITVYRGDAAEERHF
jgi:hypothetical protein